MRRGFTLLEILMGLALFALVLTSALGVLQWALAGTNRQQTLTRSAFLAQGQMERFFAKSHLEDGQGRFEAPFTDYTWSLKVRPHDPQILELQLLIHGPGRVSYRLQSLRRKNLRWLVYQDADCLYKMREDRREAQLWMAGIGDEAVALHPDGQSFAFCKSYRGNSQIFLSSNPSQPLFEHPRGAHQPVFSPDGSQLAFTAKDSDGLSQVFLCSLKSRRFELWDRQSQAENAVQWLPDGTLLLHQDGNRILTRRLGARSKLLEESEQGWTTSASLSNNGQTLLWMSTRDGNPEIYTKNLAKGKVFRLTEHPGYDHQPRLSADGLRVLFQSNRSGKNQVFSMNIDGSEVTSLTPDTQASHPQWCPE